MDLSNILAAPSREHWLGTDSLGRDVLARLGEALFGTVLPLWTLTLAATVLGFAAAVYIASKAGDGSSNGRRAIASLAARLSVVLSAMPLGVFALAVSAVAEKVTVAGLFLPIAVVVGARSFHEVQGRIETSRRLGFWQAHEALGGTEHGRILRYGIFGAWRNDLIGVLGFHCAVVVSSECALSFLGFGIQEPAASLGNMLAAHFDLYLSGQWRILIVITAALLTLTFAPSVILRAATNVVRMWTRSPSNDRSACSDTSAHILSSEGK